jgi:rhomboid protease GluP
MDTLLSQPLQQTESEVFRGTVTACSEHGLVLDAKGITYRLVAMGGEAALLVFPADAAAAVEELARYAAERSVRTEPVPGFIPFEGGITGALVYVAVLITVAYCAGRQTFDADWLTLGALDSSVGRAGQWWRSITALTLHLDQEHLLGNLLFGAGAGILASRMLGAGVAWLSVLVCAASANYADMLISPSSHRAVGGLRCVGNACRLWLGSACGAAFPPASSIPMGAAVRRRVSSDVSRRR